MSFQQPTPEQLAAYERQQRAAARLQFAAMLAAPMAMRSEGEALGTIARRALQLSEELMQQNDAIEALATAYTPPKVAT